MKALLSVVAVLLSACCAFAAEPPDYDRDSLKLPGRLINLVCEDLDGDGLKDIAAFCLNENKGRAPWRSVSVFFQDRGKGFSPEPDQGWPLAPQAVVFDIGDASGAGRKAIGFIAPEGLYAYLPDGRRYSEKPAILIKAASVFSQQDPSDLPRWPFFADTGGNGPDLVLMPGINRVYVYAGGVGGYRQANSLSLLTQTGFEEGMEEGPTGALTISNRIADVQALGFDSPSGRDLFVTLDDNADVWLRKPGGGYSDRPAIRFRPRLLASVKKESGSLDSASVRAVDLDGDGRCDLIVTKMAGGVAQAKSLVFIYLRQKGGGFPDKPNQTIITEGVVGPRVADVNGDGGVDILLPNIKLGITNFVNMLTSKQVNMDINVYLRDRSGRYPDSPSKVKTISFKLDVSNLGKNARPVMGMGRFTKTPGYGLAVVSKDDQVALYLPDRYSVFGDNPGLKLKVDAPTEMEVSDLNGDGIDDLVMTYKKSKDRNRAANVFLSR